MDLQQETTQTGASEGRHFIGGEWLDAGGGVAFDSLDPFTGEVVAEVAAGEREDAARAVAAAHAAFPGWSKSPPAMRHGMSLKAADVLESRQDEIVSLLARETGCTFGFAMFQAHVFVPGLLRQAAALAYAPLGEVIPSDTGAFSMGLRRPVGVVGAIAPWNAALILSARSIAAPLALGNTVVLKPSEHSPVVGGLIWGEIFTEAGLPPGFQHRHACPGRSRSDRGRADREPARSPAQLHRLYRDRAQARGGGGQKPQADRAQAGGYDPLIILADADLDYAVNATTFGAFLHQGQICMSARKIIVERPISAAFIEKLDREDEGSQDRRPEGARHDHRAADQRERAPVRKGPCRRRGQQGSESPRRGRGGGAVLPGHPAHRRARRLRVRQARRRSGRYLDRDRRQRARRRSTARTRRHTGTRRGSSRRTPIAGLHSRSRSTPGSSTSTTSRSRTSHRCRSAGSRTAASDGSGALRSWTSSPSFVGSLCRAARIRSRSDGPVL